MCVLLVGACVNGTSDPSGGPPDGWVAVTCNGGYQFSCTVSYNGSTTIEWYGTNLASCSVTKNGVDTGWTGITGKQPTGPLATDTVYRASCKATSGASGSGEVTIKVLPPPG
jgi:hypothetical protein